MTSSIRRLLVVFAVMTFALLSLLVTGATNFPYSGYQFWLNKLNQFDGNFERAEMVKAFLVSGEYRQRFSR